MTTIITDGSYLLADHRVCNTVPVLAEMVNDEMGDDVIDIEMSCDRMLKIIPCDHLHNLILDGARVEAIAFAGKVSDVEKYLALLESFYISPVELGRFQLSSRRVVGPTNTTMVGVTSDHRGFTVTFTNPAEPIEIINSNEVIYVGSGARHIATIRKLICVPDLEDMMMIAASIDEATSPSYSVYGVNEKTLYTRVTRTKEYADQRVKEILRSI